MMSKEPGGETIILRSVYCCCLHHKYKKWKQGKRSGLSLVFLGNLFHLLPSQVYHSALFPSVTISLSRQKLLRFGILWSVLKVKTQILIKHHSVWSTRDAVSVQFRRIRCTTRWEFIRRQNEDEAQSKESIEWHTRLLLVFSYIQFTSWIFSCCMKFSSLCSLCLSSYSVCNLWVINSYFKWER